MNSEELEELARQAVELPGWKWTPRTRTVDGWSVLFSTLNVVTLWHPNCPYYTLPPGEVADRCGGLDLSDPATGGILFDMLGAGWHSQNDGPEGYRVWGQVCGEFFRAPHLAEACAMAAVALGRWPEAS